MRHVPRFLAPAAVKGDRPVTLTADEAHHLRDVLRLEVGAEVGVFDGCGREWRGRVTAIQKESADIELVGEIAAVAEPPVLVTLGVALLKGDQMDAVIRDATMLGVAEIAPVMSAHVTVPSRAVKIDRWQRVAIASAKQCRRAVVPVVRPLAAFSEVLERRDVGARLICTEPGAAGASAAAFAVPSRPASALLLVGPEGGWSAAELALAVQLGATPISLGPRTLRAEAAPTVALAALWTLWGWSP